MGARQRPASSTPRNHDLDTEHTGLVSTGQEADIEQAFLYPRIVVKAGTGILTGPEHQLDIGAMERLVDQLAVLHNAGSEVLLVTSGAVAAGRHALNRGEERRDIPFRQALAAVGQSRLMEVYQRLFDQHDMVVAQVLLTWNDLANRQGYLNVRNTALALLEAGVTPIFNENDVVAPDEIGEVFGDNDRLSALITSLVDADLLIILTDIDGLYTADPRTDPEAQLIERVEKVDDTVVALAGFHRNTYARGGMPTKLDAAKLVTSAGIPTVICNGRTQDPVVRIARGEGLGTYFAPTANRVESRKRWMLSALANKGEIVVDAGAASALREQSRSLLPAGVSGVQGNFQRGDTVYIVTPPEAPGPSRVACGIANYGSADVERIKGIRSDRIQEVLGYHYGQEVVHRNNLVIL